MKGNQAKKEGNSKSSTQTKTNYFIKKNEHCEDGIQDQNELTEEVRSRKFRQMLKKINENEARKDTQWTLQNQKLKLELEK